MGADLQSLPFELISHILAFLPLADLLPLAGVSRTLRFVCADPTATPLPAVVRHTLDAGPPYPAALAGLGAYAHVPRRVFIPVLVRADPEWILDSLVLPPGIAAADWQEAFAQRFLPSWTRYKHPQDTWRAVFLRILRTLLHRRLGCTHEEAWTRFIILHRNTTASLNRIYSRSFDPLTIYAELRAQNALVGREDEGYRQETRLVVALQDVNIFLLGTTADPGKSLFVNPNAYTLLHPPGVEEVVIDDGRDKDRGGTVWARLEPKEASPSQIQTGTTVPDSQNRPNRETAPPESSHAAHPSSPESSHAAHPSSPSSSTGGLASLVNKLRTGGSKPAAPARGRSSNATPRSDMISGGENGTVAADNEHRPITERHRRRSSFLSLSLTRTLSRGGGDTSLPLAAGTSGQSSNATNTTTSTAASPGGAGGGGGWTGLSLVRTRSSRTHTNTNDGVGVGSAQSAEPADGTPIVGGNILRRRLSVISRTLSRDTHHAPHGGNPNANEQGGNDDHARGEERGRNTAMDGSGSDLPAHASQGGETNHVPGSAPIHPALALAAAAAADIHSTDDNDHNASSHAGDGNAERGADGATYLPYPIITHPQPAASHGLYPNYTPFDDTVMALLAGNVDGGGGGAGESGRQRGNASFMRDTRQGRLVAPSPARKYLPMSVPVGAEWEEGYGWRTWVGPVLLFAQLSSSAAHPSSAATGEVDPTTAQIIDGPIPPFEFGPRGMYASFDWADLDALAPWLELPQVENGNDGPAAGDEAVPGVRRPVGTHRAGMGFGT